jgi:tetratricopeptide (TPR) repeat protein
VAAEDGRRHQKPRRSPRDARGRGPRGEARKDRARSSRGRRPASPDDRNKTDKTDKTPTVTVPDDVSARQLSGPVRRQLHGLPDRVADLVARHLVMAGRLLDEDPERAHQHALAARSMAARVGVVREACGETAYAAGHYAEALSELRAARRITGSPDYLPIMADCERALRRPERAVRLARDPAVARLDPAGQAEMTIVAAGARRDLGQLPAALRVLEAAPLTSQSHAPWVARLRYAYADALAAADRWDEAVEWFHRTVAVDDQSATDAAERIAALERGDRDGS